jgi:hypothetical protein
MLLRGGKAESGQMIKMAIGEVKQLRSGSESKFSKDEPIQSRQRAEK